jgi:Gas vesicle synthesis protein GvpO
VADEERAAPRRKRRGRAEDSGTEKDDEAVRDEAGGDEAGGDEPDEQRRSADAGHDEGDQAGNGVPAAAAARRAARYVADFTGRHPESIVSVDRRDGDWQVGVEVVESRRIPDTTDVLAIYEVRLDGGGRLVSYRRTRRFTRGQLDKECR